MKLRAALIAMLALVATTLHAHDSWLVREGDHVGIVTGTRYPRAELVPPPESVAHRHCTNAGTARACWMELREFDIVLDDRIVNVYFKDARPADSVVSQWHRLHADGKDWRERYRKFARIEIGDATPQQREQIRQPANLDLELLPVGNAAFETGAPVRFVVLSKGEPVKDRPVELVSERNPLGLWSRTDEHGEVAWPLPFPGGWLVRTILIEPDGADRFASRFATFAFQAR
jgi:uncharacterized GH25 family protein